MSNSAIVSLYVVRNSDNLYFGGFDNSSNKSVFIDNPLYAKKFTNKYDVKLRPEETLVEISVDLEKANCAISQPFRPQFRKKG